VRKTLQIIAISLWCILCFVVFFPPMVLFPTVDWRLRMARAFARWWSRGVLLVGGIELTVEGREHLGAQPAVFLFNHTSNLDFFVNAVIAPHGSLVFGKRELGAIPLLGWVWLLSGHPLIRRKDRDDWQRKLDWVQERLSTGRYSTIIAPEGTRNHGAALLPFKKGPFHLAMQSKSSIVPWLILGSEGCLTARGLMPGHVTMKILPPISTADWTAENLDQKIAEIRTTYLAALGQREPVAAPEPVKLPPPVGA
jgi:putative phosphoserine phosphatase / 1-acylglycerol-3-phosphate O-acyltransferase